MKTIGLIGGISPESSVMYYKFLNAIVRERLGGSHSAKCILYSVDFAEVAKLQKDNNWEALNQMMISAARSLEQSGADIILICSNTMNFCSDAVKASTSIPLLHIAEATGQQIVKQGLKKVGLLGTKFTMEQDFYQSVLSEQFGLEVVVPEEAEREIVHNIIYKELVNGRFLDASREQYKKVIEQLEKRGVEGVILGCTEIPLLISSEDTHTPIFDTTKIHAEMAVDWALLKNLHAL